MKAKRVFKKLFAPRLVVPTGLAAGALVLWNLGALPVPGVLDTPDPVGRAMMAFGIAMLGALLGYLVLVLVTRSWPGARAGARERERQDDQR